jgi:hypothetical protein
MTPGNMVVEHQLSSHPIIRLNAAYCLLDSDGYSVPLN